MEFSDDQLHRYARHIILQEVGGVGQEKLLGAKVLVVGAGGLGSPVLMYLAAAGVGTIGVIDFKSSIPNSYLGDRYRPQLSAYHWALTRPAKTEPQEVGAARPAAAGSTTPAPMRQPVNRAPYRVVGACVEQC